jgi:flagellar protein FlgJ
MIAPTTSAIAAAAPNTGTPAEQKKLKAAAQQFEAVFLRQMIASMRQASPGDGLFDSSASDQFRDMADARVADDMATKGGLGIAEMLIRHLGAKDSSAGAVESSK